MEARQQNPDIVNLVRGCVEQRKFNRDSFIWVVHLGEPPTIWTKRTYGFDWKSRDDFFSHFMGLSLSYRVDEITFETVGVHGNVNCINLYLVELEPGEDTNITVELLEAFAEGWEVAT